MSIVYEANVTDGLFPEHWDAETGQPLGGKSASRFPCSGSDKVCDVRAYHCWRGR